MIHSAMNQRRPAARGAVQRLISRVARERDPSLHRMGVMSLLRRKMPLMKDQKKAILKMVRSPTRGLLPKRPPIPKKGKIEVRHYAMNGFMKDDLKQMERAGFNQEDLRRRRGHPRPLPCAGARDPQEHLARPLRLQGEHGGL